MKIYHEESFDPEVEYTISEEWKQINGFPNYAVSNKGRVMNLKTGRVLKPIITPLGYAVVALSNGNGKSKQIMVHRLVAQAFIPNSDNLFQINHIDEDKTNNDVTNLEWCTASENRVHSNHQYSCKINQLSLDGKFIKEWESAHEIQRELGFAHNYIIAVCKNKFKQAYGFKWRYADGLNQQKQNRPVAALTKDGEFIAEYKSAAEASRCLKIKGNCVYLCLNGTYKSTHGLIFIYTE